MKLNPAKCIFATTSWYFLGFIISQRGIEENLDKIVVVEVIQPPHNLKTLKSCIGKIVALGHFLSQCSDKCAPLFEGIMLGKKFNVAMWIADHQEALDHLKAHLKEVPTLSASVPEEKLFLYVVASNLAVSSVLVHNANRILKSVYFVSQVYTDSETRYSDIEKIALALVHASWKMRPYFQAHKIVVLTLHPLRQVLSLPMWAPHVVKWALEFAKFDITYKPRTTNKAQVLVDFLSNFVPPTFAREEWELYIDGSSLSLGIGVLLKSPSDIITQHVVKLMFEETNNEAEYEALLSGLRIATLHKVRRVKVFTDSQLITQQISGAYQVKELCIQAYLAKVQQKITHFKDVDVEYVPHSLNAHADALARLASATTAGIDHPIIIEVISKPHPLIEILEILEGNRMKSMHYYLTAGQIPDEVKDQCRFRLKSIGYTILDGALFN